MKIRAKTQDHITQTTFLRILAGGALAILIACASTIGFAAGSDSGSSGSSGYSTEGANKSKELREAIKLINRNLFEAALVPLALETMQNPKNADAWNYTGFALRKSGRYDESMTAYNKALEINPEHEGALEYQGELYLTLKQPDMAKANLAVYDNNMIGIGEHQILAETIEEEYKKLDSAISMLETLKNNPMGQ